MHKIGSGVFRRGAPSHDPTHVTTLATDEAMTSSAWSVPALLGAMMALPVVLLIRLLRPLILLRFGSLPSSAIGPLAVCVDNLLNECDAGWYGPRVLDCFYRGSRVCNEQLFRMWRRVVPVHPFFQSVDRVNRRLPGGHDHEVPFPKIPMDQFGLAYRGTLRPQHLEDLAARCVDHRNQRLQHQTTCPQTCAWCYVYPVFLDHLALYCGCPDHVKARQHP